jgi:CRP-like cAMP-binding protein
VLARRPWPFYAQVIQEARLLFIEKEGFAELLEQEERLKDYLLDSMSQRLCDLFSHMEALCLQTSRERVVGYLLREIEQSRARGNDEHVVELPDTKANTASLLNLTPETFSRIIHTLEREKIINVSRRSVRVLDLARMQQGCGC